MSNSSQDRLGELLGGLQNGQDQLSQQISPGESEAFDQQYMFEPLKVGGNVQLVQKILSTTAFVLDHPVYGELDSSTLHLDGGYDTTDPDHDTVIATINF